MTTLLQTLLAAYRVENNPAWVSAVDAGVFYIVAEITSQSRYAMGSTSIPWKGKEIVAPFVHPTLELAREEQSIEQADFEERQRIGNEEGRKLWKAYGNLDSDFVEDRSICPHQVYMMKWDGGDQVEIYSECGKILLDTAHSWQWHCGINAQKLGQTAQ